MKKVYYTAVVCMPNILLFNLYNRQTEEVHVVFSHVLILAGFLSTIGIILYFILKWLASKEVSILVVTAFWAFFWYFGALRRFVFTEMSGIVLTLIIAAFLAVLFFLLNRIKPRFSDFQPVFLTMSAVLLIMFVVNAAPAFYHNAFSSTHIASEDGRIAHDRPAFTAKNTFEVDQSLPSPDIYWIHLDGMVSLSSFESFWGVCQNDVRYELRKRGFLINEEAYLRNAAGTKIALPMLLSPHIYDSYLGIHLMNIQEGIGIDVRDELLPILDDDEVNIHVDIIMNNELFSALLWRGYMVHGVNTFWNVLDKYTVKGYESGIVRRTWKSFAGSDFPFLIFQTTPLPLGLLFDFFETVFVDPVYLNLNDVNHEAKFVWKYFDQTHSMLWYLFDPTYRGNTETRLDLYPVAFDSITASMLESVDHILAQNPNAVIVLQSDHGLHRIATQQHLVEIGLPEETILELAHSVFSAVRIPEAYGGLYKPVDPLNITRILINRFVGENYELLERN